MKAVRLLALLHLYLFAAVTVFSLDVVDTDTHIMLTNMTQASKPMVSGHNVIFSYEPKRIARHVGIAFAHENFQTIHSYERNQHGVYVFVYRPSSSLQRLTYRIVVDGLWMPDPKNQLRRPDPTGVTLSYVSLDNLAEDPPVSPRITAEGLVEFVLKGDPGMRVYVAGSFNHWDPFMHRLRESSSGTYKLKLRLPEGIHSYHYVVNGRTKTDPLNRSVAVNYEGRRVSVLRVD